VEAAKSISAHRILLSGESSQLAQQQAALAKLNPNIHGLTIYMSDSTNLLQRNNDVGNHTELSKEGLSNDLSLSNAPEPSSPTIEFGGFEIGR
jgi:hypothetical protein